MVPPYRKNEVKMKELKKKLNAFLLKRSPVARSKKQRKVSVKNIEMAENAKSVGRET